MKLFGWPASLRARLVLAFAGIVALALVLVLAALPRLLDGYFAQQEQDSLEGRADIVSFFVRQYLSTVPEQPILLQTQPLTVSASVLGVLGDPDQGRLHDLAATVAQSNVQVDIWADPEHPELGKWTIRSQYEEQVLPGQQREPISAEASFRIRDTYWSRSVATAPERLVTIRLSEPFTFRAQTLQTVVGVMISAALIALGVATVLSLFLANRLTTPIQRLTDAARALSEGRLHERVQVGRNPSPEVAELADTFNVMAERLERSMEVVRQDRDRSRDFLADVSHELRTPIAALRTFNELLREGTVVEEETRDEFLESSRAQIERLDWLATNLLELSKLESGLISLELRPDDLRAVVENAIQQAEPAAQEKGVTLDVRLPQQPIRLRHDPQRLGQVLSNLVGNALKFTPTGGRIRVRLASTRGGAILEVSDTGVGIDANELPHVFERFFRGSRGPEARAAGSGLGLSIVKSIVDMHHGHISVESRVGEGTRVTVALPRETPVASGPSERAAQPDVSGSAPTETKTAAPRRRLRAIRPLEDPTR